MDNFQRINNLCRVCLSDEEDVTFLNQEQMTKLFYIGNSSEIVHLDTGRVTLCSACDTKLNSVYEFVAKFNSSKEKMIEYARQCADDPHPVDELCMETIIISEDSCDTEDTEETEKFMKLIKVEISSPPNEIDYDPFQNSESAPKRLKPNNRIKAKRQPKPKTDDKSKLKRPKDQKKKSPKSSNLRGRRATTVLDKVCTICAKEFSCRPNKLRHEREHSGRRYSCHYENCNKYFTQKSSLNDHIAAIHEGIRPFACEVCGKKFTHRRLLVPHMRVHTGHAPFECDYCQKKFKIKPNLIRHFKSHRKQAPPRQKRFQCAICFKFLASKLSLTRHLIWHKKIAVAAANMRTTIN